MSKKDLRSLQILLAYVFLPKHLVTPFLLSQVCMKVSCL
jgi:hypothetical protein